MALAEQSQGVRCGIFELKNSLFPCETSADRNERGDHILIISQHMFFMNWGNWAQSTELRYSLYYTPSSNSQSELILLALYNMEEQMYHVY